MKKLLILLAIIAPLFSFAQLSVNMVSQIASAYTSLKIHDNQMIALSSDSLSLDIYDISTQMQPQLNNTKTLTAAVSHIELMNNYLLVTTTANNLEVYSLTDPSMPLVSSFPITGTIKSLSVAPNYAFVTLKAADGNYALWYINLTVAASPVLKSYITFYNPISEMTIDGANGFLAEMQSSQTLLFVFDLNWVNLHVKSMKYLPVATKFAGKGNNVYLYDNHTISFYTWTTNGQLSLISNIVNDDILNISAISNGKCVATKANDLVVYEVTEKEVYSKVLSLPEGSTSIISTDDFVFCATGANLYVIEIQATASANLAPSLTSLNVYPNPAKESWKIDATTLGGGEYIFKLNTILGQTVYEGTFSGGDVWNIQNDFEAGTYFYTIEKEGVILANGKMIGL